MIISLQKVTTHTQNQLMVVQIIEKDIQIFIQPVKIFLTKSNQSKEKFPNIIQTLAGWPWWFKL